MQKKLALIKIVVIGLFACSFLGCNNEQAGLVKVSGQVLIDGEPLTQGVIRLAPAGSRSSAGSLDEQGRFTLGCYGLDDGAFIGSHQVEVAASEVLSATEIRWHAPKKYADINTSGLTTEITEATDSLKIELTWDGGEPFIEYDQ